MQQTQLPGRETKVPRKESTPRPRHQEKEALLLVQSHKKRRKPGRGNKGTSKGNHSPPKTSGKGSPPSSPEPKTKVPRKESTPRPRSQDALLLVQSHKKRRKPGRETKVPRKESTPRPRHQEKEALLLVQSHKKRRKPPHKNPSLLMPLKVLEQRSRSVPARLQVRGRSRHNPVLVPAV